MDKVIVALFDEETKAYEGARALGGLDEEGSIALFSTAVIAKDAGGKVIVKQSADSGPLGTTVGALTGSIAGVFGGPLGVVVGAAAGTLAGISYDLAKIGVGSDFVAEIGDELQPGKFALIAEVEEDWVVPVDSCLEKAGATKVLRRARENVIDHEIEHEVAAAQAEMAQLQAERKRASEENREKLRARIEAVKTRLQSLQEQAKANVDDTTEETKARVKRLETKLGAAREDARARIDTHISEWRARQQRRSDKLHQAFELAKEAMKE